MIELDISTGVEARDLRLDDRVQDPATGAVVVVDEVGWKRDGVHVYGWKVNAPQGARRLHLEFKPAEVVTVVPGGENLENLFASLHACVQRAERAFDEAQVDAHEDAEVREASPWQASAEVLHLRAGDRTWAIALRQLPDPPPPGLMAEDGPAEA